MTIFSLAFLAAPLWAGGPEVLKPPVGERPFQATFIGEGGGSPQPTGAASDYLEHAPRQEMGDGTFGSIPGRAGRPAPQPRRPVPPSRMDSVRGQPVRPERISNIGTQDGRSRGQAFLPRRLSPKPRGKASRPEDPRPYSLWEGLSEPLSLPPERVDGVEPDQASQLVRRDYESHILGVKDKGAEGGQPVKPNATPYGLQDARSRAQPMRPLGGPVSPRKDPEPASLVLPPSSREAGSEVFVALNLDLKGSHREGAALRDAIAGLARAAQFRPDARFAPVAWEGRERFSVWGWIPAHRLTQAVELPWVSRLEMPARPPESGAAATSEILLGVRLAQASSGAATQSLMRPSTLAAARSRAQPVRPDAIPDGPQDARFRAQISEEITRLKAELAGLGFRWRRTIGLEQVPGSQDTALVVLGEAPVRSLSRLLARPEVLKILPAPAFPQEPPASAGAPPAVGRFFSYVLARSPLLLAVTLLVLLPPLARGLARLARVFIPYQRP